jgi:hypothetical protein
MGIIQYKYFTKQQQRIFDGLQEIGPAIANFYADAIAMMQPDCFIASKTNFIAHMAREIDAGLRDVFAPLAMKNEKMKLKGLGDKGHVASILVALGKDDPNDEFAKDWFKLATQFPGVAHRHEIHGPSRALEDITELWERYEQILLVLIGSFYALTQRLDQFLSFKTAPTGSMPALHNILQKEKHRSYFFSKLNEPGWLPGLQAEGYFDLKNAPVPKGDPKTITEWWELRYLLNITKIKTSGQQAGIKSIADTILVAYTNGQLVLHPFSIAVLAEIISNHPDYGFSEDVRKFFEKVAATSNEHDLFFIQGFLKETMPKLIAKNDAPALLSIVGFVFGYSTYEEKQFDFFSGEETDPVTRRKPNLDQFQVDEFAGKYGADIIRLIGEQAIAQVAADIKHLDSIANFEFSFIALSSIEDTEQTRHSDGWDRSLLNFIRDYAGLLPASTLTKFLEEWLHEKDSLLQRLAIHLIRTKFADQSAVWWEFISTSNEPLYIHEPFVLMQEHSPAFTPEQMQSTLDWIERITPVYQADGQTDENAVSNRQYNVRRWLSALSSEKPEVKTILDPKKSEYDALNNWKLDHPEYDSYSTTSFGYDMPEEMPDFIKMDIAEQVAFIRNFKTTDANPTADEGIAQVLEQMAAQNPEKYLFSLDEFIPLPSVYAEGIIGGLKIALVNKKLSSIGSVISFAEKKLNDPAFLQEPADGYRSRRGILFRLADFIKTVAVAEDLEVSPEQTEQILQLLIALLENPDYQDKDDKIMMRGYIDHSMNSLGGRLHNGLLEICRMYAFKTVAKTETLKWPKLVKDYFTRHLDRTGNAAKDYSIILGSRLPLIIYLDKQWVYQHFDRIFNPKDEQQYEYTLGSAISGLYNANKDVYNLFKEKGTFKMILDRYTENDERLNRVMYYGLLEWQHWGVAVDDPASIISMVLQKKIPAQFADLIEVFEREPSTDYDLAKKLWRKMLDTIGTNPGFDSVLGYLLTLVKLTDTLGKENYDLVLETIHKISKESRSISVFARNIFALADTDLDKAAEIVQQIFEKNLAKPYYDAELNAFVRKLFTSGKKDKANAICIAISETGSFVLKDIYDEFNL